MKKTITKEMAPNRTDTELAFAKPPNHNGCRFGLSACGKQLTPSKLKKDTTE